ncbi:DUF3208 domain-containing protein [Marinithermus hydrothermalis]|uniref:DUF3208 domain-containing protein n=1 Tax=Marinithermus hydrothermalis (strain DSM 14884 / JCM 11576 / T1) TaxID=869210 RepID=F2NNB6_MARHT|nr:DUF3208 domain-containing protein [Marinithermus hydrothermalis]AEB10957.1 hypothetical protein Marky_0196 [Marinithermus hydrothermalis DSM 14884]
MRAVKLFQGYLWHPKDRGLEGRALLPECLEVPFAGGAARVWVLVDAVPPPFAFFEDGTPTATQAFYQVTLLTKTERAPAELKPLSEAVAARLEPLLNALPEGVGWLLLEDLREV